MIKKYVYIWPEGNHLCSIIYASLTQLLYTVFVHHSTSKGPWHEETPRGHVFFTKPFIPTQIWWRGHCMSKTNPRGITSDCVFFELAGIRKESNDHGHVLYNNLLLVLTLGIHPWDGGFWDPKRLRHSHKVVKAWDVYRCRQIWSSKTNMSRKQQHDTLC